MILETVSISEVASLPHSLYLMLSKIAEQKQRRLQMETEKMERDTAVGKESYRAPQTGDFNVFDKPIDISTLLE